jgi:hypothetical protein
VAACRRKYGKDKVPDGKPIPAQLLGNMWAQQWNRVYDDMLKPYPAASIESADRQLKAQKWDAVRMMKSAESFYTSIGFPALPQTFWERSMLTRPRDREVVCHASAWDMDDKDDVRIKMCTKPLEEDLFTAYHELGHVYYFIWYKDQPALYQDGAHDGFHEAIGDAVNLSVTPGYLHQIGLVGAVKPSPEAVINEQMKMALDKIAFLPFGKLIDEWRWAVFDGRIKPADYNKAWWELREKYQGLSAPVASHRGGFRSGREVPHPRQHALHALLPVVHPAVPAPQGAVRCRRLQGPAQRVLYLRQHRGRAPLRRDAEARREPALAGYAREAHRHAHMDASAIIDYFKPLEGLARRTEQGPILRLELIRSPGGNQMNSNDATAPQLTVRAVILAIVLAVVLAAANTYLGLFAGMTIASAIPAAVVSMAVLRALGGGGILENNIVQTGASAGTSIASGVIFTVPALVIMGYWPDFKFWWVLAIAGLGGLLGVLFSVPLRRSLIVDQQMAFPEGKAAAEVLRAGENPAEGIKVLGVSALAGGIGKLIAASGFRVIPDSALASGFLGKYLGYMGHQSLAGVDRRGLHRRAQHRHCRGGRQPAVVQHRHSAVPRVLPSRESRTRRQHRRGLPGPVGRGLRRGVGTNAARCADSLPRRGRHAGRRPVGADHAAPVDRLGREERPRRGARRQQREFAAHRARPAHEMGAGRCRVVHHSARGSLLQHRRQRGRRTRHVGDHGGGRVPVLLGVGVHGRSRGFVQQPGIRYHHRDHPVRRAGVAGFSRQGLGNRSGGRR